MDAPTSSLTPSRLRRFACMAYEAILLFGVVFLADYLLDTLTQSKHALALRHLRQAWLFVAIGVYFILCWRKKGQTLPMKTWNIQLVDKNGQTPGLGTLILRYILVWPLIFWPLPVWFIWPLPPPGVPRSTCLSRWRPLPCPSLIRQRKGCSLSSSKSLLHFGAVGFQERPTVHRRNVLITWLRAMND